MSEQLRESLSALMDDEAHELELERVLRHSEDPGLRTTWVRYHAVRQALRGSAPGDYMALDVSAGVREALAGQSAVETDTAASGRWNGLLRPVASFAVAASVFASVLVGGQLYGLLGQETPGPELAARASPVGLVNSIGGAAVNATYGAPALKSRAQDSTLRYNQLARQRLQQYMLPHAEQASLNAPRGMMPYARLANYEAED